MFDLVRPSKASSGLGTSADVAAMRNVKDSGYVALFDGSIMGALMIIRC